MRITIIYGSINKSLTRNHVRLLLNKLSSTVHTEITEFFLPKDLPPFCNGCFSCFINVDENMCSHFKDAEPIMNSLEKADLIVLASHIDDTENEYMKQLLTHLSYRWMPHRPNRPSMSNKIGLIVSTTCGSDLHHTRRLMKKSLKFWGVKKVFKISNKVSPMDYKIIDLSKRQKINKKISKTSKKVMAMGEKLARKKNILFASMKSVEKRNNLNILKLKKL